MTSRYVDVTASLRSACMHLQAGQMVHTPELTLMDAMAAIQILDPRMDGGIEPVPVALLAPCDRIPDDMAVCAFDVCAPLTIQDVLWIMDRLMACEAAWLESASLSGASLAQTIHTCLYVHELSSMHPNAPASDENTVHSNPPPLAKHVLRPYLIGVLKSVGLIWDELTKGNLIDGEDYNGDKAGVGLMESFHPQGAQDLIDDALHWVQKCTDLASDDKAAISERLQMRKNFLASVALFSHIDPTLHFGNTVDVPQSLMQAQEALQQFSDALPQIFNLAATPFSSPTFATAPSSVARAAFDPWFSRHVAASKTSYAPMSLAPPQPLLLGEPEETYRTYVGVADGMREFIKLAAGPVNGWRQWKHFFDEKAVMFQQCQSAPYVRSLWQSAVCSDTTVSLDKPLSYIADSFLLDMTGIEPNSLPGALWAVLRGAHGAVSVSTFPVDQMLALEKRMSYFMERLAGQLVAHLRNLAQNRSRSKRRLAHAYGDLLALSDEASALGIDVANALKDGSGGDGDTLHPELLFAAVQALALDTMLHGIMAGFELDIYSAQEYACAYWMAHKAAEEYHGVLEGLLRWVISRHGLRAENDTSHVAHHHGTTAFLQAQVLWASAISRASLAFSTLYTHDSALSSSLAAPWTWINDAMPLRGVPRRPSTSTSSHKGDESLAQEVTQTVFRKRFKWLRIGGRPETDSQLDELWQAFLIDAQRTRELGVAGRLADAAVLLKQAAADCQALATHRENYDSKDCNERSRQLAQSFTTIALAAQRRVQHSGLSSDDDGQQLRNCLLPLRFGVASSVQLQVAHPWFSTLNPH